MELSEEQIQFLDEVCGNRKCWTLNSDGEVDVIWSITIERTNLTEIPVKFGKIDGHFTCSFNPKLTTLKNIPHTIENRLPIIGNNLTDYFKNIKEEDFPHWDKLYWGDILNEYPFLVNIAKKYCYNIKPLINTYPQTKLYLK